MKSVPMEAVAPGNYILKSRGEYAVYKNGVPTDEKQISLEIVDMSTLDSYKVKVADISKELKMLDDEVIADSIANAAYIFIELTRALAKPYSNRDGGGVKWSCTADYAKIAD